MQIIIGNSIGVNRLGGAGPFEYTPIDNNYSMEFDGVDQYIDLGSGLDYFDYNANGWTISFWQKNTDTNWYDDWVNFGANTYRVKITNNGNVGGLGVNIERLGNRVSIFRWLPTGITLNDGNWHHICIVCPYYASGDPTNVDIAANIYVDGSNANDGFSATPDVVNINNTIGSSTGSGGVAGSMDEVAVWNSALSEGTIEAIYNTTNDNPGKVADLSETPEGVPVAWYRFE